MPAPKDDPNADLHPIPNEDDFVDEFDDFDSNRNVLDDDDEIDEDDEEFF